MTTDRLAVERSARRLLETIPPAVRLVAAVKGRDLEEIRAVVAAGIRHLGCNYVQQAEACVPLLGSGIQWHLIGHLQRNKARKAVSLFDIVETVDSPRIALALNEAAEAAQRVLPVLIEVNSGREPEKAGIAPEEVEFLADSVRGLPGLALRGLMTLGPAGDLGEARRCFRETRRCFEALRREFAPACELDTLSMGMTDSYVAAIEEGATEVRLGRALFAPAPA